MLWAFSHGLLGGSLLFVILVMWGRAGGTVSRWRREKRKEPIEIGESFLRI